MQTATTHKLSNGITVLLDHTGAPATYAEIRLNFGSRIEAEHEYGITHFLEHILCRGTKNFPGRCETSETISNLGGTTNACTSQDRLSVYGHTLSENTELLLDVLTDQITNPLFDADAIENEKGVILSEYTRKIANSNTKFDTLFYNTLFPNTGRDHLVLGTPDTIKSFTREQLIAHYKKNLSADKIIIGISGDISDSKQILNKLEGKLSQIPATKTLSPTENYTPGGIYYQKNKKTDNINLELVFEKKLSKTYDSIYARNCASVFISILSDRLYNELRTKTGQVYGITTNTYRYGDRMLFSLETDTNQANINSIIKTMAKVCQESLTTNPITASELTKIINRNKYADAISTENSESRTISMLSRWDAFNALPDPEKIDERFYKMTLSDLMQNTHDMFIKPISIITYGDEVNTDLRQIWQNNFKPYLPALPQRPISFIKPQHTK